MSFFLKASSVVCALMLVLCQMLAGHQRKSNLGVLLMRFVTGAGQTTACHGISNRAGPALSLCWALI